MTRGAYAKLFAQRTQRAQRAQREEWNRVRFSGRVFGIARDTRPLKRTLRTGRAEPVARSFLPQRAQRTQRTQRTQRRKKRPFQGQSNSSLVISVLSALSASFVPNHGCQRPKREASGWAFRPFPHDQSSTPQLTTLARS